MPVRDSPTSSPVLDHQSSSGFTRCLRAIQLIIHICRGLFTAWLILPRASKDKRNEIIRSWSRTLLAIFNIRLVTYGRTPDQQTTGALFVANHISWLDIHAINSVHAVRFIAMAEIRQWPLLGWLAAQANTLFIDREKRHEAGRIVSTTANSLRSGDCLCYFPEGTTTDGTVLKPFKSSLMQASVDAGTRIWPVAIRYSGKNGKPDVELSYADATLLQSLGKVLAQHSPVVELHFGEPIEAAGQDRRQLVVMAKDFIARSLQLPH
jgi:1-acyl-sn-glycerol-3-phosphate acyltransferase